MQLNENVGELLRTGNHPQKAIKKAWVLKPTLASSLLTACLFSHIPPFSAIGRTTRNIVFCQPWVHIIGASLRI